MFKKDKCKECKVNVFYLGIYFYIFLVYFRFCVIEESKRNKRFMRLFFSSILFIIRFYIDFFLKKCNNRLFYCLIIFILFYCMYFCKLFLVRFENKMVCK